MSADTRIDIHRLAAVVDDAAMQHREISKLTTTMELSFADAYSIQAASIARAR